MNFYKRTISVELFFRMIKNFAVAACSIFFLIFGLTNLKNAYELKNPLEFIMVFFSASLMIMISIVGIIYVIIQLYYLLTKKQSDDT